MSDTVMPAWKNPVTLTFEPHRDESGELEAQDHPGWALAIDVDAELGRLSRLT